MKAALKYPDFSPVILYSLRPINLHDQPDWSKNAGHNLLPSSSQEYGYKEPPTKHSHKSSPHTRQRQTEARDNEDNTKSSKRNRRKASKRVQNEGKAARRYNSSDFNTSLSSSSNSHTSESSSSSCSSGSSGSSTPSSSSGSSYPTSSSSGSDGIPDSLRSAHARRRHDSSRCWKKHTRGKKHVFLLRVKDFYYFWSKHHCDGSTGAGGVHKIANFEKQ